MPTVRVFLLVYGCLSSWGNFAAEAKIEDGRRVYKIMPENKESSVEERLQDSIIKSAISRVGQSKGFKTLIQGPDGLWTEYKEPEKPRKLNEVHGHGTNSDERLTRVVQKAFTEWLPFDDILRSDYLEDYQLPVDNPTVPKDIDFNQRTQPKSIEKYENRILFRRRSHHHHWKTETIVQKPFSSTSSDVLFAVILLAFVLVISGAVVIVYKSKVRRQNPPQITPVKPRMMPPVIVSTISTGVN